jgi:hypothetical protein
MGWPRQPPVAPQDAEQLRRQHDIAVFAQGCSTLYTSGWQS